MKIRSTGYANAYSGLGSTAPAGGVEKNEAARPAGEARAAAPVDEATIMGSFNADYQSMHSAEQMVMVPSDETTNSFLDYMIGNSVPHHRLPPPPSDQSRPLSLPLKLVRSYIGPRSYERLGLNSRASKALPYNRENDDRYQQRFESIDESVSSVHEQQSLNPMGNDDDRR